MKKEQIILFIFILINCIVTLNGNFNICKLNSYIYFDATEEIAKTICAEACSEGNYAMWGVANTIYNRSKQRNLSFYEIIKEPNQYYGYTNKNKDKIFKDLNCQRAAMFYAENLNNLKDITGGAIYFRMEHEEIKKWHKIFTVKINNIYFYK